MKQAVLIGVCAVICTAQTPASGPDMSAWYRLTPSAMPLYKWMRIDPPLTLTVDAAGTPHLGIALPVQVTEDFTLSGDAAGDTQVRLSRVPLPGMAILYFFHAAREGSDYQGAVMPVGPDLSIIIFHRQAPLNATDAVSMVYWTAP